MKFYRYWARGTERIEGRGRQGTVTCFEGSDDSMEQARQRALEKARRVARALESGAAPRRYGYGERPLREEIIENIEVDARQVAVITRNAYGALVLNTANVMFLDFDFEREGIGKKLGRWFAALRGKKMPAPDEQILERIDQILEQRSDIGLRLYRTANGFRGLVTGPTFDPADQATAELLDSFGVDPLYAKLCRDQQCFRARLTPKYWRCGCAPPPLRFPWESETQERAYRDWEREYGMATSAYSTCRFIRTYGPESMSAIARTVVSIHDRHACGRADVLA